MKKMLIVVVLAGVLLAGCSGVMMNARYSMLLDKTCAISAETAARAQAGTLTEMDKTAALVKQAETWRLFKDARDGRAK